MGRLTILLVLTIVCALGIDAGSVVERKPDLLDPEAKSAEEPKSNDIDNVVPLWGDEELPAEEEEDFLQEVKHDVEDLEEEILAEEREWDEEDEEDWEDEEDDDFLDEDMDDDEDRDDEGYDDVGDDDEIDLDEDEDEDEDSEWSPPGRRRKWHKRKGSKRQPEVEGEDSEDEGRRRRPVKPVGKPGRRPGAKPEGRRPMKGKWARKMAERRQAREEYMRGAEKPADSEGKPDLPESQDHHHGKPEHSGRHHGKPERDEEDERHHGKPEDHDHEDGHGKPQRHEEHEGHERKNKHRGKPEHHRRGKPSRKPYRKPGHNRRSGPRGHGMAGRMQFHQKMDYQNAVMRVENICRKLYTARSERFVAGLREKAERRPARAEMSGYKVELVERMRDCCAKDQRVECIVDLHRERNDYFCDEQSSLRPWGIDMSKKAINKARNHCCDLEGEERHLCFGRRGGLYMEAEVDPDVAVDEGYSSDEDEESEPYRLRKPGRWQGGRGEVYGKISGERKDIRHRCCEAGLEVARRMMLLDESETTRRDTCHRHGREEKKQADAYKMACKHAFKKCCLNEIGDEDADFEEETDQEVEEVIMLTPTPLVEVEETKEQPTKA